MLLILTGARWSHAEPEAARAASAPTSALRHAILSLVNEARKEHGLPSLREADKLDQAAQHHADDMAKRDYLAHVSPEGKTAFDRFVDVGGDQWLEVAENIGMCPDCGPALDLGDVQIMHQGWMHSPPHLEHILSPGLDRFGFGIAAGPQDKLYAVETFAGPGNTAQGAEAIPADQQIRRFVDLLNQERAHHKARAVNISPRLIQAANHALALPLNPPGASDVIEDVRQFLGSGWRVVATLVAVCGGCGTQPTDADIDTFYQRWINNPDHRAKLLNPEFQAAGFAMRANGKGQKVAVALLGSQDRQAEPPVLFRREAQ